MIDRISALLGWVTAGVALLALFTWVVHRARVE